MTVQNHIFTKSFWNKSRIVWGLIIGLCTSIPMFCGSVYMSVNWAEANIISPYIENKVDSACIKTEEPMKQDIRTMISDIRFTRRCIEQIVPRDIKDKVISDMIVDSLETIKYHFR